MGYKMVKEWKMRDGRRDVLLIILLLTMIAVRSCFIIRDSLPK